MKKTLLLSVMMLAFTIGAFAQSATSTASAIIVSPIAITNTTALNFGNVAVNALPGTVVLDPAGTRTSTGGVTLPVTAGTVSAASFNVTGAGSYTYTITLPSTDVTISSGANNMIVNAFSSTPSATGELDGSGAQVLNVGATLNVGGGQAGGTYTTATPFTVSVNYN